MSQVWKDEKAIPVTLIQAGPVVITQLRSKEKDKYEAVQVGFDATRKKVNKPLAGHLKNLGNFRYLREFRLDKNDSAKDLPAGRQEYKVGDILDVSQFNEGDKVKISGLDRGRGFQGVVKRHGFSGGPKSHGQKDRHRAPGSIGATAPQRVIPGRRMAGRMGKERKTISNLKVVSVDKENNILAVKGAVPGMTGAILEISNY